MGGTKILVCGTCPRHGATAGHEKTLGASLGVEIKALLGGGAEGAVRMMNCLAGCKNACNVALAAPGKTRLRFSRLGPGDGESIISAAKIFAQNSAVNLPGDLLPADLRDRLSARSPARIGNAARGTKHNRDGGYNG